MSEVLVDPEMVARFGFWVSLLGGCIAHISVQILYCAKNIILFIMYNVYIHCIFLYIVYIHSIVMYFVVYIVRSSK